jgi:hypothetical protein
VAKGEPFLDDRPIGLENNNLSFEKQKDTEWKEPGTKGKSQAQMERARIERKITQ